MQTRRADGHSEELLDGLWGREHQRPGATGSSTHRLRGLRDRQRRRRLKQLRRGLALSARLLGKQRLLRVPRHDARCPIGCPGRRRHAGPGRGRGRLPRVAVDLRRQAGRGRGHWRQVTWRGRVADVERGHLVWLWAGPARMAEAVRAVRVSGRPCRRMLRFLVLERLVDGIALGRRVLQRSATPALTIELLPLKGIPPLGCGSLQQRAAGAYRL
mmetsp:Transcript_1567/g.3520  ORF Transcript_1567/g.3520 Transcript_1567/m.3520 type:complete len:215 (-) Transcript_1567:1105-1749(-)